jgi:hypothetical protein
MLEYFLIDRIIHPILARPDPYERTSALQAQHAATAPEVVWMTPGKQLSEPHFLRIPTAVQLAGMFVFVSLAPTFAPGASVYLKLAVRRLAAVGAWITFHDVGEGRYAEYVV